MTNGTEKSKREHWDRIGDSIAYLLGSDLDLPDYLNDALRRFMMETMPTCADVISPRVAARLYVALREVAEEQAGGNFKAYLEGNVGRELAP